jgi:O-methyltransferase involved in polyketide biosynthesis
MKIQLDGVAETMLIPLWARATESRRLRPILRDVTAEHMLGKLDYDFNKFSGGWMSQVGVPIRSMLLDRAVEEFIRNHSNAVAINIGAGLDTRFQRIETGEIIWYDLDLPEVIGIRKQFFDVSEHQRMIGGSVLEESWLAEVNIDNRPVLIIAEGILMYFNTAEVKSLMGRLASAFPDAEMLIEIMPPTLVRQAKHHDTVTKTGARFKWGLQDGKDVEDLSPNIHFISEWNYFDYHRDRWRWLGLLACIPAFHKRFNNRIVHLGFNE